MAYQGSTAKPTHPASHQNAVWRFKAIAPAASHDHPLPLPPPSRGREQKGASLRDYPLPPGVGFWRGCSTPPPSPLGGGESGWGVLSPREREALASHHFGSDFTSLSQRWSRPERTAEEPYL